jgi:hypothetical protein
MGLGQLLRRANIKEETGRVFLTDILDKEIIKPRENFSWRVVKTLVKSLSKMLTGEYSRGDYWKVFHQLHDATYAPPKRRDRIFHPSSLLTDCPRRLHYEMGDVEFSDIGSRRIPANLQRTFDVGTWWHTYVQNMLMRAGVLEEAEVTVRNKERRLYGHADGVLCFEKGFPASAERFLLEIKTINSMGYRKVKEAPYDYHIFQASIYAAELGIKKIYFLYINKDTSETLEHVIDVNHKELQEAYNKIDYVLKTVENDFPPKRICVSKGSKPALECGFCTHCFRDDRNTV